MIGICLEIKTQCMSCGQPVPFNALVTQTLCGNCSRPVELPPDLWKSILGSALNEGPKLALKEGKTSTIMGGRGTTNSMYGRMNPRCEACKTELAMDQAFAQAQQSNGWCGCKGCNRWLAIRPTPPEAAALLPGVTHLIAEDTDQLAGRPGTVSTPGGKQPVNFTCPHCGAALIVDGESRSVPCNYCHKPAFLPDEVWQRLHPARQVQRWYLWYDERAAAAAQRDLPIEWGSMYDVIMDAEGTLYCVGEPEFGDHDHEFAIWAMGQDLKPRWIRKDLKYSSDTKLALHPDGALVVWENQKHALLRLNRADGSTLGKLGGIEPPNAQIHHLDLKRANDLTCDSDGSYVMLIHKRILRFTPDGQGATTWPPTTGFFARKEKLMPLYRGGTGEDDDSSRSSIDGEYAYDDPLKERATTCSEYTRIAPGPDGSLTFLCDASDNWMVRFDRQGKPLYRIKLDLKSIERNRPASDLAGNTYVIGKHKNQKLLVRIGPDGSVTPIAADQKHGGLLGEEDHMAVAPNGVVWLLDYGTKVRVIGPDGSLLFLSNEAREEDAEKAKERQEKIDNDEDPD